MPAITITTTDNWDTEPSSAYLVSGTKTYSVNMISGGSRTVTATDTDGTAPSYTLSNVNVTVLPTTAVKLLVILPGETADPGSSSGRTAGSPTEQLAGSPFAVTVQCVDEYWNKSYNSKSAGYN